MIKYAPVALFVYNRLEHTKETVEALSFNEGASETVVYVFSDAAKRDKDVDSVKRVREYIKTVKGFKKVTIIERKSNYGLADNIIDGVTEIVNKYGRVIVVEDDILTSKFFLKYMNDALDKYEKSERVMAISGYLPPINTEGLPQLFFSPFFECWGWATWKRCWDLFERNPQELIHRCTKEDINSINQNGTVQRWKQVLDNQKGKIKTWAIFFYTLIILKRGLVLNNNLGLCTNTGFDGTGENCGFNNTHIRDDLGCYYCGSFPDHEIINAEVVNKYEIFNIQSEESIIQKLVRIQINEGINGFTKRMKRFAYNCTGNK